MDLDQMRALDAIERAGTISAAATDLHLSQSTLSRSIARLEQELGLPLFDRTGNRARLNETGRTVTEHARALLREERALLDAVDAITRRQRTLRIATVAPAPLWRLTSLIVTSHPGTILEPETLDEGEVYRRLLNRACDLAVLPYEPQLPTVTSAFLMDETLFATVPETHRLASRTSITFADLAGETLLVDRSAGSWIAIHQRMSPQATLITQPDRNVLHELLRTSNAIGFVTDASPLTSAALEGRVRIPITNPEARQAFHLCARLDAMDLARAILDEVGATES